MLRRFIWGHSMASFLVCAIVFAMTTVGCDNATKPAKTSTTKSSASGSTDPLFRVPNGTPTEILKFVAELRKRPPNFSNQSEMDAYVKNFQLAMAEAGEKILAQNAGDEELREAVRIKLGIVVGSAVEGGLTGVESLAAAKDALAVVNQLRADKRVAVAESADEFFIAAQSLGIAQLSEKDRLQLVDDAIQRVQSSDAKRSLQMHVGNADLLAEQLLKIKDNALAVSLYNQLAKVSGESANAEFKRFAPGFQSKSTRMALLLPESRLELEGTMLDGGKLDWESYRGKIVLVDFWATWCGPCVAELPNVTENYNEFHERGFEVVGISLDRDRKTLESFLKQNQLPWVQLFEEPANRRSGESHPMAGKYAIDSIPTAFLVGRDGRVVSTDVRGGELRRLLKSMID